MAYMSPSRWGVVFALAVLLLISIGALHGEAPRGRKLALALVTLAVSFCFAVLMVHEVIAIPQRLDLARFTITQHVVLRW